MAVGVAHLQPARQHHVQSGAGYDTHLPGLSDGTGQLPIGDGRSHSTLNDDWLGTVQHARHSFQRLR
jgi:hypothetical protein